jgi:hypothetical protein
MDCDPVPNNYSGTETFAPSLGKYMYINGYEILITSPTEGLLYLPLIKSRVPVEWSGLTVKKGPAGADYGCITAGQVQMQGSQSGVISGDLHRQLIALLTQGPGAWSGKLSDSFDAFEKIIAEIEQTESPTPEQFKKFQNIGKIVVKALDEWILLLEGFKDNAAADNLKDRIKDYKVTIESTVNKPTATKADVTNTKTPAQELNKAYKKASVLQKILQAIKDANAQGQLQVDLTAFYQEMEAEDASIVGTTMPVFCEPNKYFPLSFRGGSGVGNPVILNLNELSLSDDKTKIEGINLQGSPSDIEGIWEWLGVEKNLFQYSLVQRAFSPFQYFGFLFTGEGRSFSTVKDAGYKLRGITNISINPETNIVNFGAPNVLPASISHGACGLDPSWVANSETRRFKEVYKNNLAQIHLKAGNDAAIPCTDSEWINELSDMEIDHKADLNFSIYSIGSTKYLSVTGTVYGDHFPCTETLIYDANNNPVFLQVAPIVVATTNGVSPLNFKEIGPFVSLGGDGNKNMGDVSMSIELDEKGNFVKVKSGSASTDIASWNQTFLSKPTTIQKVSSDQTIINALIATKWIKENMFGIADSAELCTSNRVQQAAPYSCKIIAMAIGLIGLKILF